MQTVHVAQMERPNIMAVDAALRIFIVEDSPVIRDRLIPLLEEVKHVKVVGYAETEADAKQWLSQNRWDVLVLDLWLREGTGIGVLTWLGQRPGGDRRAVRLVLTNEAGPEVRDLCLALGADAFFDKSGEIDDLTDYLRDRLGASTGD